MDKHAWVVDIQCSEFCEPVQYVIREREDRTDEEIAEIAKELAGKDHPEAEHTVVGVARL